MEENKLTKEKFIQFLKENVNNFGLDVNMVITPSKGWNYEISAYVTDVVFEPTGYNMAFISNAFSGKNCPMTVQDIIDKLSEDDECQYIVFEIYAFNKKTETHEQIVSTSSDTDNLTIIVEEDINTVNIIIEIDAI